MPFAAVDVEDGNAATTKYHHGGGASTGPRARWIIGFILGVLALTSVPYLKNTVGIMPKRSTLRAERRRERKAERRAEKRLEKRLEKKMVKDGGW
jgi:hypothetical protein